jgi:aspartyl-tRNA(Asn)/glutamyl-tRNA(Gln) amidotransferase subunit A
VALPDLASAVAQARSGPDSAERIAAEAIAALQVDGGRFKSFISVAATPTKNVPLTSRELLGCVFSVKDNIDVAGMRTTCGSSVLIDAPPARQNAWIVSALEAAGAVCIGKNNMHEFALGATGENRAFGTTANPWDERRSVGGSSGGSANAVALRQVHLAIGTDSGGSVRQPGCFAGIVGFKPTMAALPMAGVAGSCWTLDCLGLFTTQVSDLARVWSVLVAHDRAQVTAPARLRVGYLSDDSWGRADSEVWRHYLAAVGRLQESGFETVPLSMPGFNDSIYVAMVVAYAEVASQHVELIRNKPELYDQAIRGLIALGEVWSSRLYLDAQRLRPVLRRRFAAIAAPFDALLTPTVAIQPPTIGIPPRVNGDSEGHDLYTFSRFTVPLNVIGYPAISIPCGLDNDGLPIGIQIIGKPGQDLVLLRIAQRAEETLGVMPPPPVLGGLPYN